MSDEFANNVAQKFPNTTGKYSAERPWDVAEPNPATPLKLIGEDPKQENLSDRINSLYSELRSSLTVPAALEFDLKKATQVLDEVNKIKAEVEKIVEMLKVMEEYMRERIK